MDFNGKVFTTVIFLGAGASRGAIDHVLLKQKRIKPPLNGDFFQIAETYARAVGKKSQAQQRLNRLYNVFKRDLPMRGVPTMEEAFSLLYIAKDFPEIYKQGKGPKPDAGVRQEISDFFNLLFPILSLLDNKSEVTTGYDRLASRLTDGDTIITLNYDTMLDSALHRRGWNPRIGYGIAGNTERKVSWSALDIGQPLKVELLKLHGSMNWFVRGDISNLRKIFSSKPVKITQPRSNGISAHMRQIAPPIYRKVFEHSHWQSLWTKAFKALCAADVIVVVGCSLIDTDFPLRALLSQVARTRKRRDEKFRRAYFVDKVAIRNKWKLILRNSFMHCLTDKRFDGFLNNRLVI